LLLRAMRVLDAMSTRGGCRSQQSRADSFDQTTLPRLAGTGDEKTLLRLAWSLKMSIL
jgi:hypothetical protein